MDLKSLYTQILNEHNLHPSHKGTVQEPTITLQGVNPSCGDNIYVQLKVDASGTITEGAFNGSGCAVSQASADIMLDLIEGRTKEEALELADAFLAMVRGTATDEQRELLEEAAALEDVAHMPARAKCATLGWHTLEKVLRGEEETN